MKMKHPWIWAIALLLCPLFNFAQYTEIINSNRPGLTIGAYSVGSNVFQVESGLTYRSLNASMPDRKEDRIGLDVALRYGLYFETLEVMYEGSYTWDRINFDDNTEARISDISRNRIGVKFLLFDPYKNPERNKPNLYSWRKNNLFQWKNLIPAVSIYGGANYIPADNPYYEDLPQLTYRAMLATQSHLSPRLVLSSNVAYDQIQSDFPEWNVLLSLSHALGNPTWSVFGEVQFIQSDLYEDQLIRTGVAHLFPKNLQADLVLSSSLKADPSWILVSAGLSYRFDRHEDKVVRPRNRPDRSDRIRRKDVRKRSRGKNRKNKF